MHQLVMQWQLCVPVLQINNNQWGNVTLVLKAALSMERKVNKRLVEFVRACATDQNYHVSID